MFLRHWRSDTLWDPLFLMGSHSFVFGTNSGLDSGDFPPAYAVSPKSNSSKGGTAWACSCLNNFVAERTMGIKSNWSDVSVSMIKILSQAAPMKKIVTLKVSAMESFLSPRSSINLDSVQLSSSSKVGVQTLVLAIEAFVSLISMLLNLGPNQSNF